MRFTSPNKTGRGELLSRIFVMLMLVPAAVEAVEVSDSSGPERHLLSIPRIAAPPRVDGEIGANEWTRAAATTGFTRNDTMTASRVQPVVWAAYDDKAIYFAFVSPIPEGTSLVATVQGVGGAVWNDDDVEVLLQPGPPDGAVFHFMAGPAGGYDVSLGDKPSEGSLLYRTKVSASQWVAEVSIPFAAIGAPTPQDGATWGVNLCRGHASPRVWTSWAPALNFSDRTTLGRLRFAGSQGAAVQVTSMGNCFSGELGIEGNILAKNGQFDFTAGGGPREALQVGAIDPGTVHKAAKSDAERLGAETRRITVSDGIAPIACRKTIPAKPSRILWEVRGAGDGAPIQRHDIDIDPLPPLVMDIHSSPLRGTVEVHLNAEGNYKPQSSIEGMVRFRRKDQQAAEISSKAEFERDKGTAIFQLKDLPEGEYIVEASVQVGSETLTASDEFLRAGEIPPSYLKLGLEPEVPAPWTPVMVDGSRVDLWNRSIAFGASGLPIDIRSAGLKVLAKPIVLRAFAGGVETPAATGKSQLRKLSDGAAEATGSMVFPGISVSTRSLTEFDGCTRIELNIKAEKTAKQDQVVLEVPLRREFAKLLQSHTLQYVIHDPTASGDIPDGKGVVWNRPFVPFIWIGNTQAGLSWFAASQKGWAIGSPEQPTQEIVRTDDQVLLRIHLATKPFPSGGTRQIVFGLQATPVKPIRPDWRLKERYIRHPMAPPELLMNSVFFENAGKWWGWPEPKSDEQVKKMEEDIESGRVPNQPGREPMSWATIKESRDQVHADGGRTYWYAQIQQLALHCPWYSTFGQDWYLTYGAGYENPTNPWWNSKPVCPASRWQDLYIGTIDHSLTTTGFDGVYLDTFLPWKCANADHGCGYVDDEGKRQGEYTIWSMREQMKRLYRVVHSRKNGSIIGHISSTPMPPIYGFIDSALNGEQYWSYFNTQGGVDYHDVLPLDKCRTEVMGRQWGWAPLWLPQFKAAAAGASREMLSLILLHDCLVIPVCMDQGEAHLSNAILFRLGFVDSQFVGYFDSPAPASTDSPEVLVSAYKRLHGKAGSAILIVTNHGLKAGLFHVSPNAQALELGPGEWRATLHQDLTTTTPLPRRESAFDIEIPAKDFRIVSIDP